ncbi:MAG: hypothetical protein E7165_02715 [Firmicutes bacterium]|nr:hypothetical protein [Bacillota bacterium]
MHFLIILTIAISLSMDAFSLSLAYGTFGLCKKDMIKLSTIVGIYHFFMPLIGLFVGKIFLNIFPINPDIIVFIVLVFIGVQMLLESLKKENIENKTSFLELLIFGLAVSIDSFSVGIGLSSISSRYIICACIFSLTSFLFTYLGLNLGKVINHIVGKISTALGGLVLILIGIIYLF